MKNETLILFCASCGKEFNEGKHNKCFPKLNRNRYIDSSELDFYFKLYAVQLSTIIILLVYLTTMMILEHVL